MDAVRHQAARAAAEAVLTRAWGAPVALGAGASAVRGSARSTVLRCPVRDGPQEARESVILKVLDVAAGNPYGADEDDPPFPRFYNEWASLQLLTEVAAEAAVSPRFYGGDRDLGVLVMEDLGQGDSLVEPLLGSDRAAADAALDAYFGSLARLNGLTCGHHDTYWRLRDRLGPRHPESLKTVDGVRQKLARLLDTVCTKVGITVPRQALDELALVARAHVEPGPLAALSQHDTCPDQCILQDGRARFFDFEYGWFGNALDDGVRARGNFATCWCVYRLPEDVIRRVEAVYRATLAGYCPAATDDDIFARALTAACGYWAIASFDLYRHPRHPGVEIWQRDMEWGPTTMRQRAIYRLAALGWTSAETGCMPALGELGARLAAALQARWPEVAPMPCYPAYCT